MKRLVFAVLTISVVILSGSLSAYETNSENQTIVFDQIISTHMDEEQKQEFIDLRGASYFVFKDAKVYNKYKRKCRLNYLRFPFNARIVLVKDAQGQLGVIEIRPHEE